VASLLGLGISAESMAGKVGGWPGAGG